MSIFQKTYPGISEKALTRFEEQHKIKLQDDHKSFLLKHNGGKLVYAEYDDSTVSELSDIYGIGNGAVGYDLIVEGEESPFNHFFSPKFLNHMMLIGSGYGGDPFVQVIRGGFKGQIYLLDHEVYYGGVDRLLDVDERDELADVYGSTPLEKIETDVLIANLSEWAIELVAEDFIDLVKRLEK